MRRKSRAERNVLMPRLRVFHDDEIALGPGKADLLEAIARSGTISGAARRLGMSYMRAWGLVRTMNGCFKRPLVAAHRGGSVRGAAVLTETGRQVLALYRGMEAASRRAAARSWQALRRALKS